MASTRVRSSSSVCLRSVISRPAQMRYSTCWLALRWGVIVINMSRCISVRGWILASKCTVSPRLARAIAARNGCWTAPPRDHAGRSVNCLPTTSSRRRCASARRRWLISRISPSGVKIVTPSAELSSRSRYLCSFRLKACWRCSGSSFSWKKSARPSSVGERETCSQLLVTGEAYSTSVCSRVCLVFWIVW